MSAQLTPAAFDKFLKVVYPEGPEKVWYPKAKFLSLVRNTYNFVGSAKQTNPFFQGLEGGNTFADAVEAMSTIETGKFLVTRKKTFVLGSIDNETIEAASDTKGAIAESVKATMDGAYYSFGRVAAFETVGDGTGTRGTVSSFAAGVITLTTNNDSVKFEKGMRIVSKTAGVLNAGFGLITAIDRAGAKLTVTKFGGWPDPVLNDTLARKGDYTSTGGNVLNGIFSWIPVTAPTTGDNHFGQDRSLDVNRLAGTRFTGTGTIEESLIDGEAEGLTMGGSDFDTIIMHTKRAAELKRSLQAQAMYEPVTLSSAGGQSGKVSIAYKAFAFQGENGPVAVIGDPNFPYPYGLLTEIGCWELSGTPSGVPHFHMQSGSKLLTSVGSDGQDFRMKAYWNLLCHRPVNNVLITW